MTKAKPPRLAMLLLRLRLSKAARESVVGDLLEEYSSGAHPPIWFWRQTWSAIGQRYQRMEHLEEEGSRVMKNPFSGMWNDVQYAGRTLRRNPGFAVVAVLALGFGIGVNTTVFSLLNAIALRPLPVERSTEVVSVYQSFQGRIGRNVSGAISYFSYPEYKMFRDDNRTLSGLAASALVYASLAGDTPRRVSGQIVTCNFFSVVGRTPTLGRGFAENECATPDASSVVVLEHDFWRTQFNQDPTLIGKTIVLNRRAFTVVGIAPPNFPGTSLVPALFWAPITMQAALIPGAKYLDDANLSWLEMVGRLKPGMAVSQARADLAVILNRIDQANPPRKSVISVEVATLLGDPDARTMVFAGGSAALFAVGLVLMIACANIANLLLARAAARRKEIGIRLASGASRWRLIRMLLTESMSISILGGAAGVVFTSWSAHFLFNFVVSNIPRDVPGLSLDVSVDMRVLGYAFLVSLLTSAAFGLAPALQATRIDLNSALKDEGAGLTPAAARGWLRSTLVGVQVSVCLILLVAAGLLMRGLQAAQTVDPAFITTNTLAAEFDLKQQGYDDAKAALFNRQLVELLSSSPGVESVAMAAVIPLSGSNHQTSAETGEPPVSRPIRFNTVSHEFFGVLGIPIVRGRGFTEAETKSKTEVKLAVVSESTARRLWPGADPIGKRMLIAKAPFEVIGVARDARLTTLSSIDQTYVYFPAWESGQAKMSLLVHSSDMPAARRHIRRVVDSLDSAVIVNAKSLEEHVDFWRKPSLLLAAVAGTLGFVGLLLASVGIYGVVSYGVNRRIRELGIRITLGADQPDILRLIIRQGMRPVAIGLAIGFVVSLGLAKVMSFLLYGVSPADPMTFAGVSIFLFAVALVACYLPARRATRVDPIAALRYE